MVQNVHMRSALVVLFLGIAGCGAKSPLPEPEVELKIDRGVASYALGTDHTCAVFRDGSLKCWGFNGQGQLGDGTRVRKLVPTLVPSLEGVTQISLGHGHSCALLSNGAVRCWGDRSLGQVGDGIPLTDFKAPTNVLEPADVVSLGPGSGVTQLSLGEAHSCALVSSGEVFCWGVNDIGELGDGRRDRSSAPRLVKGLSGVTQIAAGLSHTCALLSSGTLKCWGSNEDGQLGGVSSEYCGSYDCARAPIDVLGVSSAVEVAVGGNRTCVRISDGSILCFGRAVAHVDLTPTPVSGISDVAQIALGRGHACARKTDGTVWCWGNAGSGQLGFVSSDRCPGTSTTTTCSLVPKAVPGIKDAVFVAAGGDHTCALTSDGTLKCWGKNTNGEVGDGTTIGRFVPVPISF